MFRFTNLLILRITRDCNLNCKYCFMRNKDDFKGELLSFEDFKILIKNIIEQRLKSNKQNELIEIVFHGGEVLMLGKEKLYQYSEYLTEEMNKNGLKFALSTQTNATLLDDEFAKILNHFGFNIGLSFDGIENSNDERNIKQSVFEQKFEILKNNKLNYGFIIVAGKNNVDKIADTEKYLQTFDDVKSYRINFAEDMTNRDIKTNIEVDGNEFFEKVTKPEVEYFLNGKENQILNETTLHFFKRAIISSIYFTKFGAKTGCESLFCGGTINMIGVNPDMTAHYCDRYDREYEETFVCNIKDYDFLGFHQISRAIDFNRILHQNALDAGCDTCFARYACDGGCTGFHRSKTGKNGIDKNIYCKHNKAFYSYVLENLIQIINVIIEKDLEIAYFDKIVNIKLNMQLLLQKHGISADLDYNDARNYYIVKFKKDKNNG